MLATFIIETACVIYVLWRYKLTPITRLAAMILAGLATFQLAEYNICEGAWGVDSLTWARIGYVAITLLPPLGFHLATKLAGQKQTVLVSAAYGAAAVFSIFFLFIGHGMQAEQCLGNYVIFSTASWAIAPYTIYYYGLLFMSVGYAWQAGKAMKSANKRKALSALALGYLAFVIPTTAVNIVDPSTIAGIPSIMCGFAVILALVLTFVVLPRHYAKNQKTV
jgi:hypothetical protein